MFELTLSYLLKKLLRDFVDEGDVLNEKVQVGVWSGLILLENLILKPSLLDLVNAPIALSFGFIGKLEIQIPWSRLGTDPVLILIERIHLLLEPKYEWNMGAAGRRENAIKQARLAAAELFAMQRHEQQQLAASTNRLDFKSWFSTLLLGKIIDNIQITVRELHIRYEDKLSCPMSFCVGLSFESLLIQTREAIALSNGREQFGSSSAAARQPFVEHSRNYEQEMNISGSDSFHKLIELNHLAIYWNALVPRGLEASSCPFVGRPAKEILALMTRTTAARISKQFDKPRHHYILQPVDMTALLDMAVNMKTGNVKSKVRLTIPEIAFTLQDKQIREIISLSINMANFIKLEKFSDYRPHISVHEDPRQWWQYAIKVTMAQIKHEKRKGFNKQQMMRRYEDKMVYMELWKSRIITSTGTFNSLANQQEESKGPIDEFDREQSKIYQSILTVARRRKLEMMKERRPVHKTFTEGQFAVSFNASTVTSEADGNSSSSYMSRYSDRGTTEPLNLEKYQLLQALERDLPFEDLLLFRSLAERLLPSDIQRNSWLGSTLNWLTGGRTTEEERRNLLDALKYDADNLYNAGTNKVERDEVTNIISLHIHSGSLTLALSPVATTSSFSSPVDFLKFTMEGTRMKVIRMGSGAHVRMNFSLQEFEGFELLHARGKNKNEMIQQPFIFRRSLKAAMNNETISELESHFSFHDDRSTTSSRFRYPSTNPLITAYVEMFPDDVEDEISVQLALEELEVWLSPTARWIDSLIVFSTWPEDLKYWSEMEMKAMNELSDMKSKLNAKLSYMMENHVNVSIEGQLHAPVLVVHHKPTGHIGKVNLLVVDLGLITINTDKFAKVKRDAGGEMRSQITVSTPKSYYSSSLYNGSLYRPLGGMPNSMNSHLRSWKEESKDDSDEEQSEGHDGEGMEGPNNKLDHSTGPGKPLKFTPDRKMTLLPPSSEALAEEHRSEDEEEDWYDIFRCRVSNIEVYFIDAVIEMQNNARWNVQYDADKTTMIERFTVNTEILVSVLPWDETLAPVKLRMDIAEIHIKLSQDKIVRAVQYVNDLVYESSLVIKANAERLRKYQLLTNSSLGGQRNGKSRDSSGSIRRSSISRRKYRRRSNSATGSVASTLRPESEVDVGDGKSIVTAHSTEPATSSIQQLPAARQSQRGVDSDSDDSSFYSVEEDADRDKAIVKLQSMIAQRESRKNKLVSDLRLCELDQSKAAAQQVIMQEMNLVEAELHRLKVEFVEMLVNRNDYINAFDTGNMAELQALNEEDGFWSMRERLDNIISMPDNGESILEKKRDFLFASTLKLPSAHTLNEGKMTELHTHRELLGLAIGINNIFVDLELPVAASESSDVHISTNMHNGNSTLRLQFSALTVKLRHLVLESHLSLQLREVSLVESVSEELSRFLHHQDMKKARRPLLTSDAAYAGSNRFFPHKNVPNFLRISYNFNSEVFGADQLPDSRHSLDVRLGFLALSLDSSQVSNLAYKLMLLERQLSNVGKKTSKYKSEENKLNDALKEIPKAKMALKIKCITLGWYIKNEPVLGMAMKSLSTKASCEPEDLRCSLLLKDFTMFDLLRPKKKISASGIAGGYGYPFFGKRNDSSLPLINMTMFVRRDTLHATLDSNHAEWSSEIIIVLSALDITLNISYVVLMAERVALASADVEVLSKIMKKSSFQQTAESKPLNLSMISQIMKSVNLSLHVRMDGIKIHIPMDYEQAGLVLTVKKQTITLIGGISKHDFSDLVALQCKTTGMNISLDSQPLMDDLSVLTAIVCTDEMKPPITGSLWSRLLHDFSMEMDEFPMVFCNEVHVVVLVSKIKLYHTSTLASHAFTWLQTMDVAHKRATTLLQLRDERSPPIVRSISRLENRLELSKILSFAVFFQFKLHSMELAIQENAGSVPEVEPRSLFRLNCSDISMKGNIVPDTQEHGLQQTEVSFMVEDIIFEDLGDGDNRPSQVLFVIGHGMGVSRYSGDREWNPATLTSCLTGHFTLSDESKITMEIKMADMHFLFHDDSVSLLLTHAMGLDLDQLDINRKKTKRNSSSTPSSALHDDQYAHPSSIPMACNTLTTNSKSFGKDFTNQVAPLIVLSSSLFYLLPVLMYEMKLTIHELNIWIRHEEDKISPEAALCLTHRMQLNLTYFQPTSKQFAVLSSDSNELRENIHSTDLLSISIDGFDVGIYVARWLPTCLSSQPSSQAVLPSTPSRDLLSLYVRTNPSSDGIIKWLLQCSGDIKVHVLLKMGFVEGRTENYHRELCEDGHTLRLAEVDISFETTGQIHIHSVQLLAPLDYRPFFSLKALADKYTQIAHLMTARDSSNKERNDPTLLSSDHSNYGINRNDSGAVTKQRLVTEFPKFWSKFMDFSQIKLKAYVDEISVLVLNDILSLPLLIGRFTVTNVAFSFETPNPTDSFLLAILSDGNEELGEEKTSVTFTANRADPAREGMVPLILRTNLGGGLKRLLSLPPAIVERIFPTAKSDSSQLVVGSEQEMDSSATFLRIEAMYRFDYLNQQLIAVEPICEPAKVNINIQFDRSSHQHLPNLIISNLTKADYVVKAEDAFSKFVEHLNITSSESPSASNPQVCNAVVPSISIILQRVNLNITKGVLDSLILTIKCLQSVQKSNGKGSFATSGSNCMILIRNDSGVRLKYWCKGSLENVLPANCEEPFDLNPSPNSFSFDADRATFGNARKLSFSLEQQDGDFGPAYQGISLEGLGFRVLSLDRPSVRTNTSNKSIEDRLVAGQEETASNQPSLALELTARDGIKCLTIRSTMRVYNSSHRPLIIQLMGSFRDILWEASLPSGMGTFVPAYLCSVGSAQFVIRLASAELVNVHSAVPAVFPCPLIPGFGDSLERSTRTADEDLDRDDWIYSNAKIRRKKLQQSSGAVNALTYHHWLRLRDESHFYPREPSNIYELLAMRESLCCCNVFIEAKGMPFKKRANTSSFGGMIRNIRILPTVNVVNLLGSEIEVAILPNIHDFTDQHHGTLDDLMAQDYMIKEIIGRNFLRPGEIYASMSIHATESFHFAMRFLHDSSSLLRRWSEFVEIPRCENQTEQSIANLTIELPCKNGAHLIVSLEVVDEGGCRTINLFTPYWIAVSSFLSLKFQHDVRSLPPHDKAMNGTDELAADQIFDAVESRKKLKPTSVHRLLTIGRASHKHLPRGIGQARGLNGIILGPRFPLKGLSDILNPVPGPATRPLPLSSYASTSIPERLGEQVTLSIAEKSGALTVLDQDKGQVGEGQQRQPMTFTLSHCSFSSLEKRQTRVRFRHRSTGWSSYFNLESSGVSTMSLSSLHDLNNVGDYRAGSYNLNSPFFKGGDKVYSFGASFKTLEPPYQRTKVMVVVDRFMLTNYVGQTIEVKQYKQDAVFALRSGEDVPMWWRPGPQILQVRLARYGWNWSGKFDVNKDGEIPVRLRNDYDNTVFFITIFVSTSGPRVSIVFKGGDRFSPYRFENHTVESFRIYQKGQSLITNLLPYHSCAYAWDEPLGAHAFHLSMLMNALQAQDEWREIGVFVFDRLEILQRSAKDHLHMRVVAQGPTRVFQIFDSRINPPLHNSFNRESYGQLNSQVMASTTKTSMMSRFLVMLEVESIGVSVVDSTPEELVYASLIGISMQIDVKDNLKHLKASLGIHRVQIDNQLWNTAYPSIIHPLAQLGAIPLHQSDRFIALEMEQSFDYEKVVCLPKFRLFVAPFDVNLEGTIILKLIALASACLEEYHYRPLQTMMLKPIISSQSYGSLSKRSIYDVMDEMSLSPYAQGVGLQWSAIQHIMEAREKVYANQPAHYHHHSHHSHATSNQPARPQRGLDRSRISDLHDEHSEDDEEESSSPYEETMHMSSAYLRKILQELQPPTIDSRIHSSTKIYIQLLDISEIRFNLSFNPIVNMDLVSIRNTNSLLVGALNTILLAIGSTIANIDNCPLNFLPYHLDHMFVSRRALQTQMISTYTIQMVKQVYLIFFSSELLGNPLQFLQLLSAGFWDFVNMPAKGLFKSPEEFLAGLLLGSSSLVRTLISSVCTLTSHFANSLQVGLVTLGVVDSYPMFEESVEEAGPEGDTANSHNSMSAAEVGTSSVVGFRVGIDDHRAVARKMRTLRPTNLLEALRLAYSGFALDPYRGYRMDGMPGLAIGVVKGTVGLAARPLYGLLGFTSHALDRISFEISPKFFASQKLRLARVRPPRFFMNAYSPLRIYVAEENVGQELLSRVVPPHYREEGYLWHTSISSKQSHGPPAQSAKVSSVLSPSSLVDMMLMLILTRARILVVEDQFNDAQVHWQCSWKNIISLEVLYDPMVFADMIPKPADRAAMGPPPILVIYYYPSTDQQSRRNRLSPNQLAEQSSSGATGNSQGNRRSTSSGLRISQHKLHMLSHESMLQLLHQLSKLGGTSSSLLSSPEIRAYLRTMGVDDENYWLKPEGSTRKGIRASGSRDNMKRSDSSSSLLAALNIPQTPSSAVSGTSLSESAMFLLQHFRGSKGSQRQRPAWMKFNQFPASDSRDIFHEELEQFAMRDTVFLDQDEDENGEFQRPFDDETDGDSRKEEGEERFEENIAP